MSLKLFICGDIVSFNETDFINDNLKSVIKNCDFAVCNFEAPIETTGANAINKAGPHLKQNQHLISYLKESGFNIASIANNHIYDYGQNALQKTIETFKDTNIQYVGAGLDFDSAYSPLIIENESTKIALISVCENEFGCLYEKKNCGGYAWIFSDIIEDNIRKLKSEVDFIIVITHAGVEDISLPLIEWRQKYRRFCDIGADLVVGHHPHVPQGYESYGNSKIFYSLGNFYFEGAEKELHNSSYSIILNIEDTDEISTEIIYHKKSGDQISLTKKEDVNFNLDLLNKMLSENYEKSMDDICVNLFNKYYLSYYEVALGKKNILRSIYHFSKKIIKKLIFRKVTNKRGNLLLLHNIRIESHRFVVQRALSILSE